MFSQGLKLFSPALGRNHYITFWISLLQLGIDHQSHHYSFDAISTTLAHTLFPAIFTASPCN
jgi:hypothetical protein